MTTIRMLGLDPSLTNTGYAVVEVDLDTLKLTKVVTMGTITTQPTKSKQVRKSSDDLARARHLARGIAAIIKDHGIKVTVSEVPSGAQDAKASRAFGIVVGLLGSLTTPVIEVTPTEVKLASHGTKTADKEDIVRWAVEQTRTLGCLDMWNTSKAKNDWEIMIGDRCVTKTMEHQADAIAGTQAAINTTAFREFAGMVLAVLS